MERGFRLSTFVHTNVLLAILCDTKKSVRQRDPFQPIVAHPILRATEMCLKLGRIHFDPA